jgi:hypothetical protein
VSSPIRQACRGAVGSTMPRAIGLWSGSHFQCASPSVPPNLGASTTSGVSWAKRAGIRPANASGGSITWSSTDTMP